jgi:DNA-binding transcriptional ArsR family regulator
MEQRDAQFKSMRDMIAERTIVLDTLDPITRSGFTQVPNFILTDDRLTLGARITYAMFLHYAWHKDRCFPGQDRLAVDIGMSKSRVNEHVKELEGAGLVEITRRGQGKTNFYKIEFVVRPKPKKPKS